MIETELIELMAAPNALLKTMVLKPRLEPPYQQRYVPSARGLHKSLIEELHNWRRKFLGRSALEFKHCVLTINIRRNQNLQSNLDSFLLCGRKRLIF